MTPYSWKIVTTANCTFSMPFECPPVAIWVNTPGVAKTATIEGIWGGLATPNDDECWLELEFLGSASSPQASFVNDGKANLLATAAAQTESSALAWPQPALTVADNNGIITGGVTITVSSSSGGARAASFIRSGGKYYFEITYTVIGNVSTGGGLTATGVLSTVLSGTVIDALAIYKSGNIWIDGANSGTSLGAFTHGQVVCYAIDFENDRAWLRLGAAGNWNNNASANPATNVGGLNIAGLPDGCPAGYCLSQTDVMTFNLGASAFVGAVPSGFAPGWLMKPFSLSATFIAQQPGWVYARVKCAKPAATFYIDPYITLS